MKKLLFLLLFLPFLGLAQSPMSTDNTTNIKLQSTSQLRSYNMFQEIIDRLDVQTATGTNTYVISGTLGITSYSGLSMRVLFTNGNTASSTLNVNSLGAKTLKNKSTGANLVSGDLVAGGTYTVSYDGTNLQVDLGGSGGAGTVSTVSVVSANGLAGTVANPTTTPAITLSTTITGIPKGNGTSFSAASAGTDYQAPITLTTTGASGASTFIGNTLNVPNYSDASEVGTIINETWANLTAWTNVGTATFSVASNILTVNGGTPGSAALTNYQKNSGYGVSNIEDFSITVPTITVGTISATSFGIGFGIQSQSATYPFSFNAAILLDNTNKGKLAFYFDNATTYSVISSQALTINAADVLTFKVRRQKNQFFVTLTNNTTSPGAAITAIYNYDLSYVVPRPIVPGTFDFSIYALGGTHTVGTGFLVTSNVKKNYSTILGDSFISGLFSSDNSNRTVELLNSVYGKWNANASPGIKVEELRAVEIIASTPTRIIISIGYNNLVASESPATIMTKIATLVSGLSGYSMGTNLFITTLKASNSIDVTPLNTSIRSTYPTSFLELYYPSWSGTGTTANTSLVSPDGVHYTPPWFKIETEIYATFFSLSTISITHRNNFPNFNKIGNVSISNGNQFSGALYPIDVYHPTATQFRATSANTGEGGAYITSANASTANLSGGVSYDGTNWVARAAQYGIFGTTSGSASIYVDNGITIGSNVSLAERLRVSTTGTYIASAASATSTHQLSVGSTTSTAIRFGFSSANTGGYLTSGGAGTAFISNAADYNGTNWTARGATAADIYGFSAGAHVWYVNTGLVSGNTFTPTQVMTLSTSGGLGIGVTPTAILHLKAGTATASTAPLKFNSGTSLTAPEAGAMEFTTDDLFFTITTGTARKRILSADPSGGLTSGRVSFATTNGRVTDDAGLTYASSNLTVGAANNIVGVATNNSATAGNIGEEINAIQSTYTNYTTTATYQNITSITLSAGDWDISAEGTLSTNSSTLTTSANTVFVISTTTASAAGSVEAQSIVYIDQNLLGTSKQSVSISPYRVSLSGSTTYYLNTQSTFTLGNPQFVGSIRARRMR